MTITAWSGPTSLVDSAPISFADTLRAWKLLSTCPVSHAIAIGT